MLCSLTTLRYFKAVAKLFSQSVAVYFKESQPNQADNQSQPYDDQHPQNQEHSFSFIGGGNANHN